MPGPLPDRGHGPLGLRQGCVPAGRLGLSLALEPPRVLDAHSTPAQRLPSPAPPSTLRASPSHSSQPPFLWGPPGSDEGHPDTLSAGPLVSLRARPTPVSGPCAAARPAHPPLLCERRAGSGAGGGLTQMCPAPCCPFLWGSFKGFRVRANGRDLDLGRRLWALWVAAPPPRIIRAGSVVKGSLCLLGNRLAGSADGLECPPHGCPRSPGPWRALGETS